MTMKNYYDFFEKCLQSSGTNMTYCSKMANDIVPSKKYQMNTLQVMSNLSITSNLSIKQSEGDFNNWKVVSRSMSFTNDDARYYLDALLNILEEAHYLETYSITLSETNDSLVAIMKASDNNKKAEIYELFGDLPKAFNSRVLAYLS